MVSVANFRILIVTLFQCLMLFRPMLGDLRILAISHVISCESRSFRKISGQSMSMFSYVLYDRSSKFVNKLARIAF